MLFAHIVICYVLTCMQYAWMCRRVMCVWIKLLPPLHDGIIILNIETDPQRKISYFFFSKFHIFIFSFSVCAAVWPLISSLFCLLFYCTQSSVWWICVRKAVCKFYCALIWMVRCSIRKKNITQHIGISTMFHLIPLQTFITNRSTIHVVQAISDAFLIEIIL